MSLWKKPSVEVRAAHPEELALLQADLAKDKRWEQVDLSKSIVGVVTREGEIVQFVSARLIWQIEPLKWIRGKKKTCSPFQQAKATLLAIRWIENWLRDPHNNPFIRAYFCVIAEHNVMRKLAIAFGMRRIYQGTETYGKDL